MDILIYANPRKTTEYTIRNDHGGGCDINKFPYILNYIITCLDGFPDETANVKFELPPCKELSMTEERLIKEVIDYYNESIKTKHRLDVLVEHLEWKYRNLKRLMGKHPFFNKN